MLDIKDIVRRPDFYKERLGLRGVKAKTIDEIIRLEKERIRVANEVQEIETEINKIGKDIAIAKRTQANCTELLAYSKILKELLPIAKKGNLTKFIDEMKESDIYV